MLPEAVFGHVHFRLADNPFSQQPNLDSEPLGLAQHAWKRGAPQSAL
jgi:hypothetical protein